MATDIEFVLPSGTFAKILTPVKQVHIILARYHMSKHPVEAERSMLEAMVTVTTHFDGEVVTYQQVLDMDPRDISAVLDKLAPLCVGAIRQ